MTPNLQKSELILIMGQRKPVAGFKTSRLVKSSYCLSCCCCLFAKSCLTLCDPMDCNPPGGSVCGISQTRILEWVAMPCSTRSSQPRDWIQVSRRWILYHLSHQGSPRILEWVAYLFFRGSSQPRNWTQVSHITDGFFTIWVTREAQEYWSG